MLHESRSVGDTVFAQKLAAIDVGGARADAEILCDFLSMEWSNLSFEGKRQAIEAITEKIITSQEDIHFGPIRSFF
jgi:hypothetical protein